MRRFPQYSVWWWLPAGGVWLTVAMLAILRMMGGMTTSRWADIEAGDDDDSGSVRWSFLGGGRVATTPTARRGHPKSETRVASCILYRKLLQDGVFGNVSSDQWAQIVPGAAVLLSWSFKAGADVLPQTPDAHECALWRTCPLHRRQVASTAGLRSNLAPRCFRRKARQSRSAWAGASASPMSSLASVFGVPVTCRATCLRPCTPPQFAASAHIFSPPGCACVFAHAQAHAKLS
jgi:hypothetical protein